MSHFWGCCRHIQVSTNCLCINCRLTISWLWWRCVASDNYLTREDRFRNKFRLTTCQLCSDSVGDSDVERRQVRPRGGQLRGWRQLRRRTWRGKFFPRQISRVTRLTSQGKFTIIFRKVKKIVFLPLPCSPFSTFLITMSENTSWRGRLCVVDLLIKVACFCKKDQ